MKASRITAVGLVAGAALWIASGHFLPHESHESRAAITPPAAPDKLFRVAVQESPLVMHQRKLVLSGRTEAERKLTLSARTGGVLTELRVRRGSRVKQGDVIAVLSDEAREAQVVQARALVEQRKVELEAKRRLIDLNAVPRLELANLEAQYKAAMASLAAAEAERDRGVIRAPWDGVVTELTSEVGGAAFSFMGKEFGQMVALDPMLAVVEVSERRRSGVKIGQMAEVRLVNGQTAQGRIRYVSPVASQATRTYRIEVEVPNADGSIPDGITAEVSIPLDPMPGTRIPRSALTYSSAGQLGIRLVNAGNMVEFFPIQIIEDDQGTMWVNGLADGARVIVQGQDFVREGQRVDPAVIAAPQTAQR
jgi:multidrug efflux system membrane fusion protein